MSSGRAEAPSRLLHLSSAPEELLPFPLLALGDMYAESAQAAECEPRTDLEAASSRFLKRGYAGTPLGSIASDIGITTPALYWHFSSKEELFASALEQMLVNFVTFVGESVDARDPVARLAQTVAAHVTWQLEQSDVASAYASTVGMKPLLAGLAEEYQGRLLGIQRNYMRELRSILATGKACGKFHYSEEGVAAYAIVTMCEYVHVWFNPGGRLTVRQVTQQLVEFALRSVGADPKAADADWCIKAPAALPAP